MTSACQQDATFGPANWAQRSSVQKTEPGSATSTLVGISRKSPGEDRGTLGEISRNLLGRSHQQVKEERVDKGIARERK